MRVDPGICGFSTHIQAFRSGPRSVCIEIESACDKIQELSSFLEELNLKSILSPISKNPVFIEAEKSGCHSCCPIVISVIKAAEVALEIALPKDVQIAFKEPQGDLNGPGCMANESINTIDLFRRRKMAQMSLRERFWNRFTGKDVDMTPVGSTTTYGVVDFMKKCGHERPKADVDPVAMTELALAGPKYAGFEWVKAMGWDITALSEAMGCELGTPAIDRQFYINSHPYAEGINGLDFPSDFLERGRFPVYKEHFRLLKEKVGDEMVIFGETEGAFTCAANLVGTEQFMKWCFKQPDNVQKVLEVTKEAAIAAANFAFDNGADYYVFAEPTASPALLSPRFFKKFVLPIEQEIIKRVKGPVVLHICANTDPIIELMCETGCAGISIEEKADMKKAVEIAHQKGVKVFGNVATATTIFNGTPQEVYEESIRALENGTDFLCPGCGIAPPSPLENVKQLRKARDDYFKK